MTVNQNDVLRCTAEMSIGVDDIQNVLHYQLQSGVGVADAQALLDIDAILTSLYVTIQARIVSGLGFDNIRVQNITQDVLLGSTGWTGLTVGGSTGELLPRQSAALVTYPTSVPKTRAGVFFGGFTENDNGTGALLSSGLLADLATISVAMLIDAVQGSNTWRYVLVNRALGTVIPLVSAIVPDVWRTQRRRRQGVGS